MAESKTSKRIKRIDSGDSTKQSIKRKAVRLTTGFPETLFVRLQAIAEHRATDLACQVQQAVSEYVDKVEREIQQAKAQAKPLSK